MEHKPKHLSMGETETVTRMLKDTVKTVQTPKEENSGGAELTQRCWDLVLATVAQKTVRMFGCFSLKSITPHTS
jgi:hypothetical protein